MTSSGPLYIETLSLDPPSLQDNTGDADRLAAALQNRIGSRPIEIPLLLLKRLPDCLRNNEYQIKCALIREPDQWKLLYIAAADDTTTLAGLAIDLGTTRISMRLLNLENGQVITETSFVNPQIDIGLDILSRVHYADNREKLSHLNDLTINRINEKISLLCQEASLQTECIMVLAMAGNTVMTHFFLGLPPDWIIREPYIPVTNRPGWQAAGSIGIHVNPLARMYVFPNIGSYFGGDLLAGILYSGLHRSSHTAMLIDVGTNAEVVLGNQDWLIACAGAAGPALEGGVTQMGMLAGPGVIDQVCIDPADGKIQVRTIEDLPPKGICGSGLIELVAGLFLSGMVDHQGRFVAAACRARLKTEEGIQHLIIVPGRNTAEGMDLMISQVAIDSLLRSKAAMYTILETITAQVDVSFNDLDLFYVAGTFGTLIEPTAAVSIGMLPDIPLDRFHRLGNSSLGGATLVLQNSDAVADVEKIRDRITYLELNVNQEFMNRFSAARFLPHTDRSRFPSIERQPK